MEVDSIPHTLLSIQSPYCLKELFRGSYSFSVKAYHSHPEKNLIQPKSFLMMGSLRQGGLRRGWVREREKGNVWKGVGTKRAFVFIYLEQTIQHSREGKQDLISSCIAIEIMVDQDPLQQFILTTLLGVPLYDFAYFSGSTLEVGKMWLGLLGLGNPTGLLARLDYRDSNNRQVVQRWYLNRKI